MLKRFLSLFLCFIILMSSSINVLAKDKGYVYAGYPGAGGTTEIMPKLKLGTSKVEVFSRYRGDRSYVKFIVPKTGKYVFTFTDVKSPDVKYPSVMAWALILDDPSDINSGGKTIDYLNYDKYNSVNICCKKYLQCVLNPSNFEKGSAMWSTVKPTYKFKKGDCVFIQLGNAENLIADDGTREFTTGTVRLKINIKLKEKSSK